MCKKLKLHRVEEPKPRTKPAKSKRKPRDSDDIATTPKRKPRDSDDIATSASKSTDHTGISSIFSKTSTSSGTSLANLKQSVLPDNPILYTFKEITEATAQFTAGRLGKSSVYKSNLRGKTVAITIRRLKTIGDFRSGLGQICNAHHSNIIKLLGGCCEGDDVYLVYDYVQGSSLADCLRNSRMPGFTVLNTWISRMQIAIDVAQALEYMHHDTDMKYVHNYLKSSSIIITEPGYRASMCHVGACYLAGEYEFGDTHKGYDLTKGKSISGEITEEGASNPPDKDMKLVNRVRSMRIRGTHGYMAPEYVSSGIVSQKNDVFAFGVILLELLAGHEPVRYVSKPNRQLDRVSLIETVNRVFLSDDQAEYIGRLRSWIDPRLKDSFPVDCAERVVRLAVSCVDSDPDKRRDMRFYIHTSMKRKMRETEVQQILIGRDCVHVGPVQTSSCDFTNERRS